MAINTYIFIGSPENSRASVAAECVKNSLPESAKVLVLAHKTDTFDESLFAGTNAEVFRYETHEDVRGFLLENQNADCALIIANPLCNLADELEFYKDLNDIKTVRVVRIFGFVNCKLYTENPKLCENYFDAVSHFSDCVLLDKTFEAKNTEVEKLKKRYKKMCLPHEVFTLNKNGLCKMPDVLLIDEARRLTFAFDDYDPIDEIELDEDTLPDEPFDIQCKQDEYFKRLDNNLRAKPIDDIFDIIEKADEKL